MVKPFDLVRAAKDKLINSDTPQLDAEVVLSHAMGRDRLWLFMNRGEEVSNEQAELFWQLVERRSHGEPIAYITGVREFMGFDFHVEPGVLIPRGDTEILVEQVIARTDIQNFDRIGNKLTIVDIGCGSGAIAVSLAKLISDSRVFALDVMEKPLEVTARNAEENQVGDRVAILQSDLFSGMDMANAGKIDVIVSNPPYIDKDEYSQLMEDVRDYEPESALTDHGDGLDFYRRISAQAPFWLRKNGLLAFEIGCGQAAQVEMMMKKNGFANIDCIRDLSGKDRVVVGYLV